MSNELERLMPLLERWSQLAPRECVAFSIDPAHVNYKIYYQGDEYNVRAAGKLAPLYLEGAIREAIEARGWVWYMNGSTEYGIAQIRIKEINHETRMRSHSSTIEALLSAYVQALEANQ